MMKSKWILPLFVFIFLASCSKESGVVNNPATENRIENNRKEGKKYSDKINIDGSWSKRVGAFGIYYYKKDVSILKDTFDQKEFKAEDLAKDALKKLNFWDFDKYDIDSQLSLISGQDEPEKIRNFPQKELVFDYKLIGRKTIYMKIILQDDLSFIAITSENVDLLEETYNEIYQ